MSDEELEFYEQNIARQSAIERFVGYVKGILGMNVSDRRQRSEGMHYLDRIEDNATRTRESLIGKMHERKDEVTDD